MNLPHFRRLAVATLAIFLTGLATTSFSAQRIGHELEHAGVGKQPAAHHHDGLHHHHHDDEGLYGTPTLSDTEHNLLHAAALLQPAALPANAWQLPVQTGAIPAQLISPKVAHASREPPFRPPRRLST